MKRKIALYVFLRSGKFPRKDYVNGDLNTYRIRITVPRENSVTSLYDVGRTSVAQKVRRNSSPFASNAKTLIGEF